MSWGITVIAKPSEVEAKTRAAMVRAVGSQETHQSLVDSVTAMAHDCTKSVQDEHIWGTEGVRRTILIRSSGHFDQSYSSVTFTIETLAEQFTVTPDAGAE